MLAENEVMTRLIIAAFIGALIGVERGVHKRPAGLRTHALMCMGATLFTIVSGQYEQDPARVASGIVTGIGFLSAGVIFKFEDKIKGVTTAAELWVLAAIGIAIGTGMYFAAITTMIVVLILLVPGLTLEKDIEEIVKKKESKPNS